MAQDAGFVGTPGLADRGAETSATAGPGQPPRGRRRSLALLGLLPFVLFTGFFLILPTLALVKGSLQNPDGSWTATNLTDLFQSQFLNAYKASVEISVVTALGGGILGALMCYAAVHEKAPRLIRPVLTTFSGVAANFAGVPLAFAFIATLGNVGIVTKLLKYLGLDIYDHGFSLFSFTGVSLTYVYFQIPLMILVVAPSLDGLRREWREAAENLGASPAQFWRHIGLPILTPSLLGALLLLFANSFSAYATAYALTQGALNLVPIKIGADIAGNVSSNPNQGDALAVGMIVIVTLTVLGYSLLERRSARWVR